MNLFLLLDWPGNDFLNYTAEQQTTNAQLCRYVKRAGNVLSLRHTDLLPPLFLCALCRGSWSEPAFFKSTLSRGSKMSKLLTSTLFMFSKIKKAHKKSTHY